MEGSGLDEFPAEAGHGTIGPPPDAGRWVANPDDRNGVSESQLESALDEFADELSAQPPQRARAVRDFVITVVVVIVLLVGGRLIVGDFSARSRAAAPETKSARSLSISKAIALPRHSDTDLESTRAADEPRVVIGRVARATKQRPGIAIGPAARAPTVARLAPLQTTQEPSQPGSSPAGLDIGTVARESAPSSVASTPMAATNAAATDPLRAPEDATVAPATTGPNPAAIPQSSLTRESRAVLVTLNEYQETFSRLDSGGAQAVWPSVDVKALDRAFAQLEEQSIQMQECHINVSGGRAQAACSGTISYVPKVGNKKPRLEHREWRFDLLQNNDLWLINRVDVR